MVISLNIISSKTLVKYLMSNNLGLIKERLHTLRHSFATHVIENWYDVASIQSLLGHNSSETTMIYVHLASPKMINVKSPLDSLDLGNSQLIKDNEKLGYGNENFNTIGLKNEEFT